MIKTKLLISRVVTLDTSNICEVSNTLYRGLWPSIKIKYFLRPLCRPLKHLFRRCFYRCLSTVILTVEITFLFLLLLLSFILIMLPPMHAYGLPHLTLVNGWVVDATLNNKNPQKFQLLLLFFLVDSKSLRLHIKAWNQGLRSHVIS